MVCFAVFDMLGARRWFYRARVVWTVCQKAYVFEFVLAGMHIFGSFSNARDPWEEATLLICMNNTLAVAMRSPQTARRDTSVAPVRGQTLLNGLIRKLMKIIFTGIYSSFFHAPSRKFSENASFRFYKQCCFFPSSHLISPISEQTSHDALLITTGVRHVGKGCVLEVVY